MALASWQKQTTLPPLVEGVMAGNGGRGGESKLKKEEKNEGEKSCEESIPGWQGCQQAVSQT